MILAGILAQPVAVFGQGRTGARQSWPFVDESLFYAWSARMGSTKMLGSVTESKVRAVRRGQMKFDSSGRMNVTGGSLLITGASRPLVEAAKKANELTIETLIATPNLTQVGPARIITFSMDGYSRNFTLGQERDELLFRLRTLRTGTNGIDPQSVLTKLQAGKPQHIIVTYRSGEIVAFLNGEQVYKSDKITGDFSNWDGKHQLVIGEEYKGGRGWNGIVDRVAIFNRFMENDEAVARYRHLYGGPPPKPRTVASTKPSPTMPKPTRTRPATVPAISTPASKPIPLPPRIPKPSTKPASFVTFFHSHCYDCHSGASAEGGLDFAKLTPDVTSPGSLETWTRIHDRVASHEMPPKDADQPSTQSRNEITGWLASELAYHDQQNREVVLRRLNRLEYRNTVNDLFGINITADINEFMTEDGLAHGFDNIGAALAVSAEQMEVYLKVADIVVKTALGPAQKPRYVNKTTNMKTSIPPDATNIVRMENDGVVLFNSGYSPSVMKDADTAVPGLYRLKIKARAVQSSEPVTMIVHGGVYGRRPGGNAGIFAVPPGQTKTFEVTYRTAEPWDTFLIKPYGTVNRQTDPKNYKGAGLFVGELHIEGPLGTWPPPSRAKLLGNLDLKTASLADARRILERVLPAAFRRPVGPDEVSPYVELVKLSLDSGKPFEAALASGLKGILCSPEFLFLDEPAVEASSDSRPISDFALASRLSYFFWRTMPDETLFNLASAGRLSQPTVLREQVKRMLADPKSDRFVESFTDHWLMLRDINFTLPDRKVYPEYDDILRIAMQGESRSFFREVMDNDLSLLNFVDSDFIMVNQRLAKLYGIEGISGYDIRRHKLPADSVRGGVLTQAAVLKVTANGTSTSPVVRGNWVLENILGTPVPPPPPNVPGVEPDTRGATTIREQLEKHRNIAACAACHRKIDPPGFALENFDVIGQWRDSYRIPKGWRYEIGAKVDSSGSTATGERFRDIRDFKKLLMKNGDQVTRCLTEKLLTFALGREMGFADRRTIDDIVRKVEQEDRGFRALIHEVVQSPVFRRP